MFYQEDLSTSKTNNKSNIKTGFIIDNTNLTLQIDIDSNFSNQSSHSELDNFYSDSDDFFIYESKIVSVADLECIDFKKMQILNKKLYELNEKINFVKKNKININPQINFNLDAIIDNFDMLIGQINMDVIANAQLTPKSTKLISSKKIFQYDL